MATIKSYTTIEQSRKLAEFLPIESADMRYTPIGDIHPWIWEGNPKLLETDSTPCWSLAALLSVLPFHLIIDNQRYEFSMKKGLNKNGETYAIKYTIFNTAFYLHLTDYYNNPIDACYEMILKLHEQNLL